MNQWNIGLIILFVGTMICALPPAIKRLTAKPAVVTVPRARRMMPTALGLDDFFTEDDDDEARRRIVGF